jgi:hypothetical protein
MEKAEGEAVRKPSRFKSSDEKRAYNRGYALRYIRDPKGKKCLCGKDAVKWKHGWVCERCLRLEGEIHIRRKEENTL